MTGAARRAVAGALVLAAGGVGLLAYGHSLRSRANEDLEEDSYQIISRTRALDQLQHRGPDSSTIVDLVAATDDTAEQAVLTAVGDCQRVAGRSCDEAFEAARDHYADLLSRRWSEAEAANGRADWMLLFAGLSFLGGTAVGLRGAAAPRPTRGGDSKTDGPDRAPDEKVEALLRKRLEDLYATRKRVWESERFAAYGELAAGLSHGLKTPLASIRAATQVALKRLGDDHPAAPQLHDVIDEVDGLVEQVKRFLQATGTGEPVPARVAPRQIVDAVGNGYERQSEERGVSLRLSVHDELGELLVDAALLEMALRNLVENALAAAPKGTTVTLSASPTEPPSRVGLDNEAPSGEEWIEIAVADDGAGIPSEVLDSRRVVSHKPGGTGLGLAIARRIVERHGGALVVDTAPDAGTTVRVVLPAHQKAAV